MPPEGQCPRCGGTMQPTMINGVRFMKCDYCDYQVEKRPTNEVIEETEEETTASGTYRKVTKKVSHTEGAWQQKRFDSVTGELISEDRIEAAVDQVRAYMGEEMAEQVEQQLHHAKEMGITPGQMISIGMSEAQHGMQQAQLGNMQAQAAVIQAQQAQVQAQKANGGWKIGMIVGAVVAVGLCMALGALLLVLLLVPAGPR